MAIDITKMTVIVPDNFVSINGVGYSGVDCSTAPSDVRVMQWYATFGEEELEYTPPDPVPPVRQIQNLDSYQTIIANWEVANTPIPVPDPTAEEITKRTLLLAGGWLSSASYYAVPGVWGTITPSSQTELQAWVSSVTDILARAQKILADGTGEAYAPTFPLGPTLNPEPQAGEGFTVYFNAPN